MSKSYFEIFSEHPMLPHILRPLVEDTLRGKQIYPPQHSIFKCMEYFTPRETRVVIIGKEPYPDKGRSNGLAFSVNEGIELPPSLTNIYEEVKSDLNVPMGTNGNLTKWTKQGVLLLNSILTIEAGKPNSHKNII